MVKGKLIRCYYQAVGQGMMQDTLSVDYRVEGKVYTHPFPNNGWNENISALQFLSYVDLKPSDINGTQYSFEEDIRVPVQWHEGRYLITNQPLEVGKYFLGERDWFSPKGDVWNSGESKAFGGMSYDTDGGNRVVGEE